MKTNGWKQLRMGHSICYSLFLFSLAKRPRFSTVCLFCLPHSTAHMTFVTFKRGFNFGLSVLVWKASVMWLEAWKERSICLYLNHTGLKSRLFQTSKGLLPVAIPKPYFEAAAESRHKNKSVLMGKVWCQKLVVSHFKKIKQSVKKK